MADRIIEAIEVKDGSRSLFIDPVNKKSNQQIVQTWAKKGLLRKWLNINFIYSLFLQIYVKMGNICKFNIC